MKAMVASDTDDEWSVHEVAIDSIPKWIGNTESQASTEYTRLIWKVKPI